METIEKEYKVVDAEINSVMGDLNKISINTVI